MMTEDQIERHVEHTIDRYDAAFMAGRIDQIGYDALIRSINEWADNQYRIIAAAKLAPRLTWSSNPNLVDCNVVNRITKALG